jgi:aromatic ring-opening dioxygenase catalytic subunit (LigB family)
MLTAHTLLVPSTPTLLIDERRGTATPMLAAFAEQAGRLATESPDAFVVVTSRWRSAGAFLVDAGRAHTSRIDQPGFGVEPRYDCPGEPALAQAILDEATRARVRAAAGRRGADTGVTVPMHLLAGGRRVPVVPVSVSDASAEAHREWGACLRRSLASWKTRVAFLVSGAITYDQHSFNLKREIAEDRDLDAVALAAFQSGEWERIAALVRKHPARSHPEVGWKHLEVRRGFLLGDAAGRVREYETLPGIGAALAEFELSR